MSRGLGKCERAVLECLRLNCATVPWPNWNRHVPVPVLRSETGIGKAELSRALRSLERKRLVVLFTHIGTSRYWITPTVGDRRRESEYETVRRGDKSAGDYVKAVGLLPEGKAVAIKAWQAALSANKQTDGKLALIPACCRSEPLLDVTMRLGAHP